MFVAGKLSQEPCGQAGMVEQGLPDGGVLVLRQEGHRLLGQAGVQGETPPLGPLNGAGPPQQDFRSGGRIAEQRRLYPCPPALRQVLLEVQPQVRSPGQRHLGVLVPTPREDSQSGWEGIRMASDDAGNFGINPTGKPQQEVGRGPGMLGDSRQNQRGGLRPRRCLFQRTDGCVGMQTCRPRNAGHGVQRQDMKGLGRRVRVCGDRTAHLRGVGTAQLGQNDAGGCWVLRKEYLYRGVRVTGQAQGLGRRQVRRLRLLCRGVVLGGNLPGPLVQPLYTALGDAPGHLLKVL